MSETSQTPPSEIRYGARAAYLDPQVPATYEDVRFSGVMGRYRYYREQRGVGAIVKSLPGGLSVLDCPCGTGRWWPLLAQRAREIHAYDVSPAMLDAARQRIATIPVPVFATQGDAEALPLDTAAVDAVFSHALTKHLPLAVQHRVLGEFARVSRKWVVCSFSIMSHVTYEIWRRRGIQGSFPVLPEQLTAIAEDVGLSQIGRRRCTSPLGVEYSVLFSKRA